MPNYLSSHMEKKERESKGKFVKISVKMRKEANGFKYLVVCSNISLDHVLFSESIVYSKLLNHSKTSIFF